MMQLLADNRQKQDIGAEVDALDEAGFRAKLQELTDEALRFLEATALANDTVFQACWSSRCSRSPANWRSCSTPSASSLFLVDRPSQTLLLRVTEGLRPPGSPHSDRQRHRRRGRAPAARASASPTPTQDPRFNPDVDKMFGYHTQSILCLPMLDRRGEVFAVAQLLNRRDGQPFDAEDEQRMAGLLASIARIFEGLQVGRRRASRRADRLSMAEHAVAGVARSMQA